MMMENFNMSCGQTELTEACKKSLGKDVITIYSPPFWQMEEEVISLLQKFLGTKNEIVIVFGTGTSGIEASLNSILEPGDKFMIAHNGLFGEIMSRMAQAAGAVPIPVHFELGKPVDVKTIAAALDRHPDVKGIGVVHGETSVGVVNPLKEIGELAREKDLLYVVDAVSSFASEELFVDDWNIDLCVVNGQKFSSL